ncbi:MAG TPA: VOC family protein [Roseiarcus sp.]|nr:VOC family protein [Roseiarcus sp.]
MFDHISIGVRDIARSKAFYDRTLEPIGYKRLSDGEDSLGYGKETVGLWIGVTNSPVPDDPNSGLHVCFAAPDRESVAKFHAAALAAGGRDNGKPGIRADYGGDYFAAYVVDPDGYRLEALHLRA